MADLPSIASRVNDIEVGANVPITETTIRKIGSDVNLLLDRLDIANGETGAGGGGIGDFFTAFNEVSTHTTTLEITVNAAGGVTTNILQVPQTPYVDHTILISGQGTTEDAIEFLDRYAVPSASGIVLLSASSFTASLGASRLINLNRGSSDIYETGFQQGDFHSSLGQVFNSGPTIPTASANVPTTITTFAGAPANTRLTSGRWWLRFNVSHRDPNRFIRLIGSASDLRFYSAKRISVESAGLIF